MLCPVLGPHSVDGGFEVTRRCRPGRGEQQAGLRRSAPACPEQLRPQLRPMGAASVSLPLLCPACETAWISWGSKARLCLGSWQSQET